MFKSWFIQVPDEVSDDLIYRWPSDNIRSFTHIVVDADAQALFLSDGKVVGIFGPGTHKLDPGYTPFVGDFMDKVLGGGLHDAQIIFVSTSEKTGRTFGGEIDEVYDPTSKLVVSLKTYGNYAVKIADPAKLVLNLVGNDDWDAVEENELNSWMSSQLLLVLRSFVIDKVNKGEYPVLGMSIHLPEMSEHIVTETNKALESYGISISRLGDFHVNLAPEDAQTLKKISKAKVMTELAGGYEKYAASEALLGAAEGMAKGGDMTPLLFMGRGGLLGIANGESQASQVGRFCTECGAKATNEAKFCGQCGKGL